MNEIGSHFVFRVEKDDENRLALKARLVLHGHRDSDQFQYGVTPRQQIYQLFEFFIFSDGFANENCECCR